MYTNNLTTRHRLCFRRWKFIKAASIYSDSGILVQLRLLFFFETESEQLKWDKEGLFLIFLKA